MEPLLLLLLGTFSSAYGIHVSVVPDQNAFVLFGPELLRSDENSTATSVLLQLAKRSKNFHTDHRINPTSFSVVVNNLATRHTLGFVQYAS
uniref:SERPIN domain-containing protein n=1 Tax=Steinernema glaseri TaxID=37863 RepID=A0A1I7YKH4_9BILA